MQILSLYESHFRQSLTCALRVWTRQAERRFARIFTDERLLRRRVQRCANDRGVRHAPPLRCVRAGYFILALHNRGMN